MSRRCGTRRCLIGFCTAVFAALHLCSTAFADIDVSKYPLFMKQFGPDFKHYLVGVGRGVFWANMLLTSGGRPIFCMPSRLHLDEGLILSLIDQEIRDPPSGKTWAGDTSVELIMVYAFIDRFPCNH